MDKKYVDSHRLVNSEVYYNRTYFADNDIPAYGEVFEWWLVSSSLADKLADKGEIVLKDFNCNWWGRTTRGQEIYMDNVMVEIARDYFHDPEADPTDHRG